MKQINKQWNNEQNSELCKKRVCKSNYRLTKNEAVGLILIFVPENLT